MNILVVTTSRADYGIYHSLLTALQQSDIQYGLVVSGTHLSHRHGYTVAEIEQDGHPIATRITAVPVDTHAETIATTIGATVQKFAAYWATVHTTVDLIVVLGDRYEMFAAVTAAVPFNLPIAHIHGGETTLGAIDDKFRHAITAMSLLHFTSTRQYAERVVAMIGGRDHVHWVGAPSLDDIDTLSCYSIDEMRAKFSIDFGVPSILVTFHPETVATSKNTFYATVLVETLSTLSKRYQIVITLPNADTEAEVIRGAFEALSNSNRSVVTIESFGKRGYFSALRWAKLLIGNTSSGLLEAPSFGRYVVNVGDRQAGRVRSANVIDAAVEEEAILNAVAAIEKCGYLYEGINLYHKEGAAAVEIMHHIEQWHRSKS